MDPFAASAEFSELGQGNSTSEVPLIPLNLDSTYSIPTSHPKFGIGTILKRTNHVVALDKS